MGKPGTPMQDRAVIREFHEACDTGAFHLAADIVRANPDLFDIVGADEGGTYVQPRLLP